MNQPWLLFDLVGTVLHIRGDVPTIYREEGLRLGIDYSPETLQERFPKALAQWLGPRPDLSTHSQDQRWRWKQIVSACFLESSNQVKEELFESLWERFCQPESWIVDDDWNALATQLREKDIGIAIASNFDERIHRLVGRIDRLARSVDRVFCSTDLGWCKPSPHFFESIERQLGLPGKYLCLVGDSLQEDYQGAIAAGWQARLLDPHRRHPDVSGRIERLSELKS
jgi:putative hydrolase of the HAD superfamily